MPTIISLPRRLVWTLLLLLASASFLHLNADFPHHSRWVDDAARFTDEGWYASGALNRVLTGHWLRQGDFNPVVAIPVWSGLLDLVFHFTGISLAAARGLTVLFGIGTVLLGGALITRDHPRLKPAFMLLLATSPLLFYFSRIAILEVPLLFFLTASALAANGSERPLSLRSLLCGFLFAVAMLVKSSALFVAPAILYLLCFRRHADRRRTFWFLAVPCLTAAACYGIYWLLCIHTHQSDFRVLYNENRPYLGVRSMQKGVRVLYRSVTWLDPLLFPLLVAVVAASFGRLRELSREPLFGFGALWYAGYSAFLVVHYDAGPRYFAVLVFPVMLLLVLFLESIESQLPELGKLLGAVVLAVTVFNAAYLAKLLLHPSYTLRDACLQIRQQIEATPANNPLVIGHGAMQTTYYTDVPALDDIGVMPVAEKLAIYHPGWLVTYSDGLGFVDLPGVRGHYRFILTGSYPVFDIPGRDHLLLYRIEKRPPVAGQQ